MFKNVTYRHLMMASLFLFLGLVVTNAQQSSPSSQTKPDQKPETKPDTKPAVPSLPGDQPSSRPPKKGGDSSQGETIIKERTEVVTLTVTVTDPYNRLVTGLDMQHFEV